MSHETVIVDSAQYITAPDDPPPLGARTWALAGVRLTDELTGEAPIGDVTITSDLAASTPRVGAGGIAGVVGIPMRAFPALSTKAYKVHLTVQVNGFVPQTTGVDIPMNPAAPATFTPPAIVDVALHRQPTVIEGWVAAAAGGAPIAGAAVTVTWLWQTPPPANLAAPGSAPNIVSLRPPLYAGRTVASGAQLVPTTLTQVIGDDKFLINTAATGDNLVELSNQLNIGIGDVLLFDPDDAHLAEYIAIVAIVGAMTPDQPARVTLAFALSRPHHKGATVRKVTVGAPAAPQSLAQDCIPGDACIFLTGVAGLAAAQQVVITGGAAPAEYANAFTLSSVTGADGYYRLPPLTRAAQVRIRAASGALASEVTYRPDFSIPLNRLDLFVS